MGITLGEHRNDPQAANHVLAFGSRQLHGRHLGAFSASVVPVPSNHRMGQEQSRAWLCNAGLPLALGLARSNGACACCPARLWLFDRGASAFSPDRSADLADVLTDGVGLAIGAVIATAVSALSKVRR